MGKFVVTLRKDGEFQFSLKAGNGQTILSSQGYATKPSCLNGIESVRKNSQDDSKFELKEGASGKWTFNLKATNGQVIGTSQAYETESGAKNGIASVKTNALEATVKEVEG